MKLVPAAHYEDAIGNSFVFFFVAGEPHCYRKLQTGDLKREPEWGRFPQQTVATLSRIVWWLKVDRLYSDPLITSFRYSNPNSCSDCGEMFA